MIDFYVMQDPDVWVKGGHAGGIRIHEWEAIFGSFGYFRGTSEPYIDGEPIENWRKRAKATFRGAVPTFPSLGRLWDVYGDYWYPAAEVGDLLEECRVASAEMSDEVARSALGKLALACEKALSRGAGLVIAGD